MVAVSVGVEVELGVRVGVEVRVTVRVDVGVDVLLVRVLVRTHSPQPGKLKVKFTPKKPVILMAPLNLARNVPVLPLPLNSMDGAVVRMGEMLPSVSS